LQLRVLHIIFNWYISSYRLGIPGFLTSEEMRKAGYPSNRGLRDQINAFRWVQKFMTGFGGDPKNVTFIGESAGSSM
jgi:carboxylesterase type B